MDSIDTPNRRILILRNGDAQKIAAGEVIDRPFSVLRELLDNSIDAGATEIEARITSGGLQEVRVTDNGYGMNEEDLSLCWLPHATSKIRTAEDIYKITTLGFRGEALSAIAAAGKLEITSNPGSDSESRRLTVQGGKLFSLAPHPSPQGTTVSCRDLFYNLPGRKKFLRSTGAETGLCLSSFIEKAAPFPDITFRLFTDDKMKYFFPSGTLKQRTTAILSGKAEESSLLPMETKGDGFSVTLMAAINGISFSDRKQIQIFVNRRRVWEYSLVQAVEYGFSSLLPGGRYPACLVFISINPDLVDFNIHPAKKEVRFRNLPEVHHAITYLLRSGLAGKQVPSPLSFSDKEGLLDIAVNTTPQERVFNYSDHFKERPYINPSREGLIIAELAGDKHKPAPLAGNLGNSILYIGQVFSLFIAVEKDARFYLIDQHAAHERIIFEELIAQESRNIQELLVPYIIEPDVPEEKLLEKNKEDYKSLGIPVERIRGGVWQITGIPASAVGMEKDIAAFLITQKSTGEILQKELYSLIACKKAVKDGEVLDPVSALALAKKALSLPHPYCPHGRPLWFTLTREELFRLVGRT